MLLDSLSNSAGLSHGASALFLSYPACTPSSRITVRAPLGMIVPQGRGSLRPRVLTGLAEQGICWLGPNPTVPNWAGMEVETRSGKEFRPVQFTKEAGQICGDEARLR